MPSLAAELGKVWQRQASFNAKSDNSERANRRRARSSAPPTARAHVELRWASTLAFRLGHGD